VITVKAEATTNRQSFRDLLVWRKSMELSFSVYRLTQSFPREEAFGPTAQLRRSTISIPSNIAEGHGRKSPREFRRLLLIARGSTCELQTQLEVAAGLGFGDTLLVKTAQAISVEVDRMLMALTGKLREKCG
jgi:four helix bundle protein